MELKKEPHKSVFRRINAWLHLWLGLVSGIIVFIVSITGAIYTFQQEIKDATERWRFVDARPQPFAPPSALLVEAQRQFPDKKPTGITYAPADQAAAVGFQSNVGGKRSFSVVFLNPYDAGLIRKQTTGEQFDFFRFIIDGHRALWLPYKIGRPVVGVAVLIFVVLLITGLVLWWPKKWKRKHTRQAFRIKVNARPKRLNYDLHNVLGFYSMLIGLVLAITGLVWSFEWVEKGVYWISAGGHPKAERAEPQSDTTRKPMVPEAAVTNLDRAWQAVMTTIGTVKGGMYLSPDGKATDPIEVVVYNEYGNFYNRNEYLFDRYTLQPLRMPGDRFSEAALADQVLMLNYDIHVGAALGLPGKILVFLASLICASLPITGFIVWWNKGRKMKP
ncbi:MAG: PepSY domain-containing protein [Sphingobacteriales bacterium]|nr:MAG: PepSY domain-containing protein [Sphingobacteriales bacterium]